LPRISTAYVKNIVRRGFNELIDPDPSAEEKALIWRHFAGECAYCGIALDRARREGRIDHAVSASGEGHNGLGNRVLACGPCNDDEKRDEHWESFLKRKNPDQEVHARRHDRVVQWMALQRGAQHSLALSNAANEAAIEVNALFDKKVAKIKAMKRDKP
jgi:HNH endonuclease